MISGLTARERAILAIVQEDLPDSPAPYADIARETGSTEAEVIGLLQRLKESGVIRRFGASIRHQRGGWNSNAMVAWVATQAQADQWGPVAARHRHVSHAYFRPSRFPAWPYTLYTMVHGRTDAECEAVVRELARNWPDAEYAVLRSIAELKKTSMKYFS
ncbi:MAG: Lrp/AsnC family transcriptional regulator [Desulfovibrio sp.]|nr:Lrp/AsnC family transcriptional regulator [Desulfovibrio sp.]